MVVFANKLAYPPNAGHDPPKLPLLEQAEEEGEEREGGPLPATWRNVWTDGMGVVADRTDLKTYECVVRVNPPRCRANTVHIRKSRPGSGEYGKHTTVRARFWS